jgi:sugar/nucleoside kinase (ribokinase family)
MSVLCSGSFVADILVPDLPYIGPPGSLTYAPNGIHLSPGGHSSNLAINLTQLGIRGVHAVGCIGSDEMGKFLVDQLENRGVKVNAEIKYDNTTAKNVALLVNGEDRRYIAELTANSKLSAKHLLKTIEQVKPSILYQGTLGGLPDIEKNLPEILEMSRKQNILNFLDVIIPTQGWKYLVTSASKIDVLHANKLEATDLTGKKNTHDALSHLLNMGIKLVIISDGENGLTAGTPEIYVEMPGFNVVQRDPTGAGDALSAGVIAHLHRNNRLLDYFSEPESLSSLLLYAQAAGAACVTGLGATTTVTQGKINNILREQGEHILSHTEMSKQ